MTRRLLLCLLTMAVIASAAPVHAQVEQGAITGKVVDQADAVVPGATVIVPGSYLEAVMLIIVSPAGHGPGAAVLATPTSRPAHIALSNDSTASAFTVRTTGCGP